MLIIKLCLFYAKNQACFDRTISLTSTSRPVNINYSSDFRYEVNEIFVLGVGFFFFSQVSTF